MTLSRIIATAIFAGRRFTRVVFSPESTASFSISSSNVQVAGQGCGQADDLVIVAERVGETLDRVTRKFVLITNDGVTRRLGTSLKNELK